MAEDSFEAGWNAAREVSQRTGSVPPKPPKDDEFYEGGYLRNERDLPSRSQRGEAPPGGGAGRPEEGEDRDNEDLEAPITEEEFREQTFKAARRYAERRGVTGQSWDELVEGLRNAGLIVDPEE